MQGEENRDKTLDQLNSEMDKINADIKSILSSENEGRINREERKTLFDCATLFEDCIKESEDLIDRYLVHFKEMQQKVKQIHERLHSEQD